MDVEVEGIVVCTPLISTTGLDIALEDLKLLLVWIANSSETLDAGSSFTINVTLEPKEDVEGAAAEVLLLEAGTSSARLVVNVFP